MIETLGPFWIIGIIVNLLLTGLALWWVIRAMRPREKPDEHRTTHDTGPTA